MRFNRHFIQRKKFRALLFLATIFLASCDNTNPWLGHVVMPAKGTTVSFDETTRTLSWDGFIFFQESDGHRIKLDKGSVSFPESGHLHVAWLDNSMRNYGITDSSAVKVGFLANHYQIPLFYYSGGHYSSIGGFPLPEVRRNVQGSGGISGSNSQAHTSLSRSDDLYVTIDGDFSSRSTSDNQRGNINIYIKTAKNNGNNYFHYTLAHSVDTDNEDVDARHNTWGLNKVHEVQRKSRSEFAWIREVVTGGEWEFVVRQANRSDFVGGDHHGNEFLTDAYLLIDGIEFDTATPIEIGAETVTFVQNSVVYELGTGGEVQLAQKTTTWEMNRAEVVIAHSIRWQADTDLRNCFLTMVPIHRFSGAGERITDTGARSPRWEREDISIEGFPIQYSKSNHARAWSKVGAFSVDAKIEEGWVKPGRQFNFNNAGGYNKMYFDFCGNTSVKDDEEWRTKSVIKMRTMTLD